MEGTRWTSDVLNVSVNAYISFFALKYQIQTLVFDAIITHSINSQISMSGKKEAAPKEKLRGEKRVKTRDQSGRDMRVNE